MVALYWCCRKYFPPRFFVKKEEMKKAINREGGSAPRAFARIVCNNTHSIFFNHLPKLVIIYSLCPQCHLLKPNFPSLRALSIVENNKKKYSRGER